VEANKLITILKMVSENEKLRAEFFELAGRYGVALNPNELSDVDLDKVSSGMFVRLGDIKGESKEDRHAHDIDPISFS